MCRVILSLDLDSVNVSCGNRSPPPSPPSFRRPCHKVRMGLASIYILISSFYCPAGLPSQPALGRPRGEPSLGSALSIAFIVETILDLSPNVWITYLLSRAVVSFQIQGCSGTRITLLKSIRFVNSSLFS